MLLRWPVIASLILLFAIGGCANDTVSTNTAKDGGVAGSLCTPGAVIACTCTAGEGTQTCRADGSSFDTCTSCVAPDTGPAMDSAPACKHSTAASTCGTAPVCDCAADQNCTVSEADGTTTCAKAGVGGAGASCYFDSDCGIGYACQYQVCLAYCSATQRCTNTQGACYGYTVGTSFGLGSKAFSTTSVCLQQCDPVSPYDVCGSTKLGCGFVGIDSITGAWLTACTQSGSGTEGNGCTTSYDCFPGYYCGSTDKKCRKYCYVGATCASGKACVAFSPSNTFHGVSYGSCP